MHKLLSFSLLIAVLQASSTVYAIDDCSKGKSVQQVYDCAEKNRVEAEADLNKAWQATKNRVESVFSANESGRKEYLDTLLTSQRAWLKYREHDCMLDGYAADKNSDASIAYISMCIADFDIARIKRLKEIP